MEQRLVLVKYGEIHLKGLNRPFFKRLLRQRLTNNLEGLHCEVREMQGRVFVSGFAPEAEAERAAALLKEEMESAASLSVKLSADVGIGKTWYDAKG